MSLPKVRLRKLLSIQVCISKKKQPKKPLLFIHFFTFSETRVAKGVQFLRNRVRYTVKARREVILSAGSFESPKLLMLSGIGPAQHLAELGIPVIVDLPVGQTMYEHIGVLGPMVLTDNIDNLLSLEQILVPPTGIVDFLNGKGPLTSNGVETLTYLRTQFSAYPDLDYPDVEIMQSFVSVGYDSTTGTAKSFRITDQTYDAVFKPLENRRAFQFLPLLLHPRSKGFLKLRSTNPFDSPLFYPNYYEDDLDLETLVASIREVIRILEQKPFQDIGAKLFEAKVPGCDFEFNTHEYWRCYVMHLTTTFHHQVREK
jgi:choline dehydrogenase-like flavoprotein